MLLSLKKNFIFIHVPKTAGSSIHAALKPFSVRKNRSLLRRLSNKLPIKEAPDKAYFRVHQKASEVQRKIGAAEFSRFETIAFVRNPFDHAVSHYEYLKVAPSRYLRDTAIAMTFEEYLMNRLEKGTKGRDRFMRLPQLSDYLTDQNGTVIVKNVLRFENLQSDFAALLRHLDIQPQTLAHEKKRVRARPSLLPYFNTTTTELVLSIYKDDFSNFGYSRDVPV